MEMLIFSAEDWNLSNVMKTTRRDEIKRGPRAQKCPRSLQWGAFRKPLLITTSRRLEVLWLG
jgi:hypothetical protein